MGRRDNELILSEAQAITADAYSTNVISKSALGALGADPEIIVRVTQDADFDSTEEDATLQVELRTAAALSGSDLTSPVTLLMSKVWDEADMVKGVTLFRAKLPKNLLKFFQLYYNNAVHNFTAGKVDAYVCAGGGAEVRP